ncbi:hypothetical protein HJB50_26650 [Rhizobium lentis]|nr:hypothetical protein [Rhizobium lentis]
MSYLRITLDVIVFVEVMKGQIGVLLHPLPDDEPDGVVARLAELTGQIPKRFFNVVLEHDRRGISQQQCGAAKHYLKVRPGDVCDPIGCVFKEGGGVTGYY